MTYPSLISDLSDVESSPARNKCTSPGRAEGQRQLRPRRVDGVTQRHLLCDAVHSAGSQLPLEGTERYNSAQMVKIKVL